MIHIPPSGLDDTNAFMSAIQSLKPQGGRIEIEDGDYYFSHGVVVGNGSATQESTRHGIKIVGEGCGPGPGASALPNAATRLIYTGPFTSDFLFTLKGPMCGFSMEGLLIDGRGNIGGFVDAQHVCEMVFRDVFMSGYHTLGFRSTTVRSGMLYGASGSRFDHFAITSPSTLTACGMLLDGEVEGLDTCSMAWTHGACIYGGAKTSYGIKLRGADNNYFGRVNFQTYNAANIPPGQIGPSILFESWNLNPGFPTENIGVACSMTTSPEEIGSGAGKGNMFLGLCESDMFQSKPMPKHVGGIGTRAGIFGDVNPTSWTKAPWLNPQLTLVSTNGGHNGCGGIGFKRAGMVGDDVAGVLYMDFFGGLYLWKPISPGSEDGISRRLMLEGS